MACFLKGNRTNYSILAKCEYGHAHILDLSHSTNNIPPVLASVSVLKTKFSKSTNVSVIYITSTYFVVLSKTSCSTYFLQYF